MGKATKALHLARAMKARSTGISLDPNLTTSTLAPTDSDYTSSAGQTLIMDTSSWPRTVTLPSSASLGDLIRVIDGTGSAATNVITINRNGHKLLGGDSDMSININRSGISLIYCNTAQGWILQDN